MSGLPVKSISNNNNTVQDMGSLQKMGYILPLANILCSGGLNNSLGKARHMCKGTYHCKEK